MMWRIDLLVIGFLAGLMLSGCAKHSPVHSYEVVHREHYVYQRVNEGEFLVVAVDQKALMQAMSEIGCGSKFICEVSLDGELYTVELHSK